MSTEQWLEDGKCKECRRAKYCSTPCKKYKARRNNEIRAAVVEAIGFDVLKELYNRDK